MIRASSLIFFALVSSRAIAGNCETPGDGPGKCTANCGAEFGSGALSSGDFTHCYCSKPNDQRFPTRPQSFDYENVNACFDGDNIEHVVGYLQSLAPSGMIISVPRGHEGAIVSIKVQGAKFDQLLDLLSIGRQTR